MFRRDTRAALTLAMAAAFSTGCDTGTGPEDGRPFDADAALEDHQALNAILQSETMAEFRAMGGGITFEGMAPELDFALRVGEELGALGTPGATRASAGRIISAVADFGSGPLGNPIISVFRRGKTFVYDADLGRYVMDAEREGAPATGVRFILYHPALNGKPDPSQEAGHADLVDEGDGSAEDIALRLVVVEGTDTVLDYATTLDVLDHGGAITVDGYIQGEMDRLDFDIRVRGSQGAQENTVDIDFEMGIASRGFLIQGSVSGVESESGEGGDIDLLVSYGSDSFQVDLSGTGDSINGTFYLNGEWFATVTGDPDGPTFAGASGAPLTLVETLVLIGVVDSTKDVFDFWEDLLDPVDELVILAIIL